MSAAAALLLLLAGCGADEETEAPSDSADQATTNTYGADETEPDADIDVDVTTTTSEPEAAAPTSSDCLGGWMTPEPGTDLRTAPLDALRARYGVAGLFVVDEMRYFEGPQDPSIVAPRYDHLRHWYVRASLQDEPGFEARWLLVAPPDGEPQVAATAPFASTGFQPGSWVGFFGESDAAYEYPGLPGLYFGIAYDFVTGIIIETGEPEGGPPGLAAKNVGCLRGT
jgi:hypothetical protein